MQGLVAWPPLCLQVSAPVQKALHSLPRQVHVSHHSRDLARCAPPLRSCPCLTMSHLLFPSYLPPSCMESMHYSTWVRILHNSRCQMTYFLSKGTLVYSKNSLHLHNNLVYKDLSHRLPQFILIPSYDLMR